MGAVGSGLGSCSLVVVDLQVAQPHTPVARWQLHRSHTNKGSWHLRVGSQLKSVFKLFFLCCPLVET